MNNIYFLIKLGSQDTLDKRGISEQCTRPRVLYMCYTYICMCYTDTCAIHIYVGAIRPRVLAKLNTWVGANHT